MVKFVKITNKNEIDANKWTAATKFNSKDRLVDEKGNKVSADFNGRHYRIIAKKERPFSFFERVGRAAVGALVVACTLTLALFSKSVRKLFTKSKENIRFGILVEKVNSPAKDNRSTNNSPAKDNRSTNNSPAKDNRSTNTPVQSNHEDKDSTSNPVPPQKTNQTENDEIPASDPSVPAQPTVSYTPEQQQIIDDLSLEMVEALGGIDQALNIPVTDWNGVVNPINPTKPFTAPVMRGNCSQGPLLILCYAKFTKGKYKLGFDCLIREEGKTWKLHYQSFKNPALNLPGRVYDHSELSEHFLNKTTRLMTGEPIGVLSRYNGAYFTKPNPPELPKDAYLNDEKLEEYYNFKDVMFYEKKPAEGTTNIFLYNPGISKKENLALLHKKFPKMFEADDSEKTHKEEVSQTSEELQKEMEAAYKPYSG